jgi:hypothetical protein
VLTIRGKSRTLASFTAAPGRGRARFRPALEVLEGRNLLSFLPPVTYPLGPGPAALAVGDFTGDGIPDLVAEAGNTVRVSPGNGDGTFQSPIDTRGLPNGDHALAVGDFDGDGNLDVVVTTRSLRPGDSNFVSVLFGNGDGTFQPPVNYPLAMYPQHVAVADFKGDGRPDLLVEGDSSVDGSPTGTQVLLNNGDGTFTSTATLPVIHPVVGDFTGNGNLDIAGVAGTNTISVFPGNGDGTFQAPVSSHVDGERVFTLAVGDFNGDSILDLAATAFTPSDDVDSTRVHLLLGQGDGTFQESPVSTPIFRYGAVPVFMAAADFYGDGLPGLIVGDHTFGDVVVLRGVGDGSFRIADSFPGVFPSGLSSGAVGDFNGDGLPDFAVTAGPVKVFLNAGDGGSGPGAASPGPAGSRVLGDHSTAVTAVEALVAGVRPQPVSPVAIGHRPAGAAYAAFTPGRPEAVARPPQQQAAADAGTPAHHRVDRAEPADAAGLADPLAADLAQVV